MKSGGGFYQRTRMSLTHLKFAVEARNWNLVFMAQAGMKGTGVKYIAALQRLRHSQTKPHGFAFQFRTTVIGVASSITLFIRKRCPSGETVYCCGKVGETAPPTW